MNGEHPNTREAPTTDPMTCPICTGPKKADEPECSVCRDEPRSEAYTAVLETEACARCHEGETWTVKGPDGLCIGQSWAGDEAQCNALETAEMLNGAFETGKRSAGAPEMLEVLVTIERDMAKGFKPSLHLPTIRKAIAKAEGRS